MLFNSFEFLVFFILVTAIYFLLPFNFRWIHLLLASCVFYMFFVPVYILILFFTIVIDYFAGIWIEQAATLRIRKLLLILSILANVGVLAVFKYYNFFADNLNEVALVFGHTAHLPLLNILLPIGLSFHTFQAMSYTIEVYRGRQKAERHIGIYALYVMFYPQLVAGPIERPQHIIHQFRTRYAFDYDKVASGLRLVLWGLLKKVLIADRLSLVVEEVYAHSTTYGGLAVVIATVFFAVQIYCDFSGYSDIAVGCARVMGFELMRNFDTPYFAKSIADFWKRWHISLTSWFRDYVYIPLGGSRVKKYRWYMNLLFVFLLSGLWHGANWTYIAWGGTLGLGLITESATHEQRKLLESYVPTWLFSTLARTTTLLFIVFSWMFFRADSLTQALDLMRSVFTVKQGYCSLIQNNLTGIAYLGQPLWRLLGCFLLIFSLFFLEAYHKKYNLITWLDQLHVSWRWAVYYALILLMLIFGAFTTNEFIYFQF
jgi:alginate O-acetyltransferase complex protein AlgI